MTKKLSIIISNRNDVAMLAITVRSCIEELRPLGHKNCEIVICDNSEPKYHKLLAGALPSRYITEGLLKVHHQPFPCLFTARETAASISTGTYILCIDSHMLIGRNMIVDLTNFMDRREWDETLGFAHAPISWAHQHEFRARHDRDMSKCELGDWGTAHKEEKTITWKGMPWICRREWFLSKTTGLGAYGALSEHKLSWGGGDMHIGIKPWLLGFKNWAVPTSPGIHIGPFPNLDTVNGNPHATKISPNNDNGYRYRLWKTSGAGPHAIGFLVSCYILGGEPMMERNKAAISNRFGRYINVEEWWDKAKRLGQNEKAWLDERRTMSFSEMLEAKPWELQETILNEAV